MNILQVDLLRRWRADDRPDGALLDALLATVNGIARGTSKYGLERGRYWVYQATGTENWTATPLLSLRC